MLLCAMVRVFAVLQHIEIRPQKSSRKQNEGEPSLSDKSAGMHSKSHKAVYLALNFDYSGRAYMSEGGESIEQLTARTLDSNYPFAEDVKLPVNFTVEEYSSGICFIGRWIHKNLLYFVKEITLLYDSYRFDD